MENKPIEIDFLKHLREEKFNTQKTRSSYTLQKLAYATTLMGLSSLQLEIGQINTSLLVYLVPWVAITFDFYIMGEDYSVKRIGAFLGAKSSACSEKEWENWVADNRDPFAPWAMPVLTTLILVGSIAISLGAFDPIHKLFFWIWLVITFLTPWGLFVLYVNQRQRILDNIPQIAQDKAKS